MVTRHMAVTAATDPRNENTCISWVRPGVANWWTAVRTNASNCCVSPSSISSASHPKTTRAVVATRRAPRSKNPPLTFCGWLMSLNLGRSGILPVLSRLIDHTGTPQETCFPEYGTLLKYAAGHSNASLSLGNSGLLEKLGWRTVFDRVEEA